MRTVTRKFAVNGAMIYFVSNGTILSESISDFMTKNIFGLEDLAKTDDNVGWSNSKTCLMFTEDNKIYRIDYDMFMKMRKDEDTVVVDEKPGLYVELKYSAAKYSDTFLKASLDYKKEKPLRCGDCILTDIFKIREREGFVRRITSADEYTIYAVRDGKLTLIPINVFMDIYKCRWNDVVKTAGDHVGYLQDKNSMLLISTNSVGHISNKAAMEVLNYFNTETNQTQVGLFKYMEISYDPQRFTDKYLKVSTKYKK